MAIPFFLTLITLQSAIGSPEENYSLVPNVALQVPDRFESASQYAQVFRPLLMEEFKAQLQRVHDESGSSSNSEVRSSLRKVPSSRLAFGSKGATEMQSGRQHYFYYQAFF